MARRRRDATAAENGVRAHVRAYYVERAVHSNRLLRGRHERMLERIDAGETVLVPRSAVAPFVDGSHQSFAVDAAGNISESPISRV